MADDPRHVSSAGERGRSIRIFARVTRASARLRAAALAQVPLSYLSYSSYSSYLCTTSHSHQFAWRSQCSTVQHKWQWCTSGSSSSGGSSFSVSIVSSSSGGDGRRSHRLDRHRLRRHRLDRHRRLLRAVTVAAIAATINVTALAAATPAVHLAATLVATALVTALATTLVGVAVSPSASPPLPPPHSPRRHHHHHRPSHERATQPIADGAWRLLWARQGSNSACGYRSACCRSLHRSYEGSRVSYEQTVTQSVRVYNFSYPDFDPSFSGRSPDMP